MPKVDSISSHLPCRASFLTILFFSSSELCVRGERRGEGKGSQSEAARAELHAREWRRTILLCGVEGLP
jgi:hypothetical protein